MSDESYVLGHTERELDRLDIQGQLYRSITRSTFSDAGITRDMRVLDIGCGSGDVSRLAAELVGLGGQVLGVDLDSGSIESARMRTPHDAYPQVSFQVVDAGGARVGDGFDALVGRFILMHQRNPSEVLRAAAESVKPGGIVVIIESHMGALLGARHSMPHSEIYDEMVRWKCAAVGAVGADTVAGLRLRETFIGAGLPEPVARLEAPVVGGSETPYYRYMVESMRSMLPQALQAGVGGMTEERLATLESRLRDEVVSNNGSLIAWPVVAAWCRKPQ